MPPLDVLVFYYNFHALDCLESLDVRLEVIDIKFFSFFRHELLGNASTFSENFS